MRLVYSIEADFVLWCYKEWLEAGKLQRVVLVIMSKATGEVLERWNFRIETDAEVVEKGSVFIEMLILLFFKFCFLNMNLDFFSVCRGRRVTRRS